MIRIKRAREILQAFAGRRVLVLGDCMLDHWLWGSVSRISPEAPVPVVDIERSTYTPGGAANVVHNLCSLGASAGIAGVIGADDSGQRLRDMLAVQGAKVHGLIPDAERPTTTKTRIIAHNQQVVRADAERRLPVDGGVARRMLEAVNGGVRDYEILVVSDYNKGVVTGTVLPAFLAAAREANIPVVAGPKPENMDLFGNATVIALNEKEAFSATGLHARSEEGAEAAAHAIMKRLACTAVLITRGDRGMSLVESKRRAHHVPALARQVYDVSGAGDTVISVLTMALAAGATLVEATQLANHAAAVVVQKVGTATVSPDEILHALREHA